MEVSKVATLKARGIAIDGDGTIIVVDEHRHCIRKANPDGTYSVLAGCDGQAGFRDGQGTNALFSQPCGIDIDREGNIIVADSQNHRIRKITSNGTVSTLAGGKSTRRHHEFYFRDGQGQDARFWEPADVTIDPEGNIFVADCGNDCIRKVTTGGMVSKIGGVEAQFKLPRAVAMDSMGGIIVADANASVRKITTDGMVSELADGLSALKSVATDSAGNIIVLAAPDRIHKVRPDGSVITNLQFTTSFTNLQYVAIGSDGNIFVSDDNAVYKIVAAPPAPNSTLAKDMDQLLAKGTDADVVFVVGDARIAAHRVIVAHRCAGLAATLSQGLSDSSSEDGVRVLSQDPADAPGEIEIKDTTAEALHTLLRFVYTDAATLTSANVLEVLWLAQRYGAERLQEHCVRYCHLNISNNNAVAWFVQAHIRELPALRELAKHHAVTHFRAIRQHARSTLAPLAEHPELILEVMMDAI